MSKSTKNRKVKFICLFAILFAANYSVQSQNQVNIPLPGHWKLGGNPGSGIDGVNPSNNILGTIPALPIRFIAGGAQYMYLQNGTGYFGIGTNFLTPTQLLDVSGGNIDVLTANKGYMINDNYVLWQNAILSNIYVGVGAGNNTSSATNNSFIGYRAGNANNFGSWNTFFGSEAGLSNYNASYNSFIGYEAGRGNYSGTQNTAIGERAGTSLFC